MGRNELEFELEIELEFFGDFHNQNLPKWHVIERRRE